MSFKLKHSESIGESLARVAGEELASVAGELTHHNDMPAAIHEARKGLKKVRTVVRLLRDDLGNSDYQFENAFFRDASHQLSDARDAQILIESLDKLEVLCTRRDLFAPLRAELISRRDGIHALLQATDVLRRLADMLQSAKERVESWPSCGFQTVAGSLKRSYRRGRDAYECARERPSFENYHEWRKLVKELNYEARLLNPLWPELMEMLADRTHELSDKLGDDHDFGVVERILKQNPPAGAQRLGLLFDLIERQHKTLRRESHELGELLFQDKPKDFAARIEALWYAW